jgi:hypothetical protein
MRGDFDEDELDDEECIHGVSGDDACEECQAMLDAWPNCPTPDCQHKINLWLKTGLCFPCSVRVIGADEVARREAGQEP